MQIVFAILNMMTSSLSGCIHTKPQVLQMKERGRLDKSDISSEGSVGLAFLGNYAQDLGSHFELRTTPRE